MLTGITLISSETDAISHSDKATPYQLQQLAQFRPIMFFLGGFFTLLFAGVGASAFTSALLNAETNSIQDRLSHIERKLELINCNIKETSKITWMLQRFVLISIFVSFAILIVVCLK